MLPVILALLGALFLLAPILVVVPMSFSTAISFAFPPPGYWLGYYAKYFTSEEWLELCVARRRRNLVRLSALAQVGPPIGRTGA